MKELKTLRYEWHLRWEAIDEQDNYVSCSDLIDTGLESLKEIKKYHVDITPEDIKQGYYLTGDSINIDYGDTVKNYRTVYRIELARYDELNGGYATASILDNQLEDYFDDGARVPKRFKQEFARNYEWASIL